MKAHFTVSQSLAICCTLCFFTAGAHAAGPQRDQIKQVADAAVRPVMRQDDVPGMAVGITVGGKAYSFDYGVISRKTAEPVTDSTLFEIGSITKTFTATLASYARVKGALDLSEKTGRYIPALRGTRFGDVSLLNLGTHTPGGLPLQVPNGIKTIDQLTVYFAHWQPRYLPGTYRTYANPGIGLLGVITALTLHKDFDALLEDTLFPALGMTSSYIHVPRTRMRDYAQGYTKNGSPRRMAEGVLSSQTYGIKTTAGDMTRFLQANMEMIALDATIQRAVTDTHIGYFSVGSMTQDLIWEQYTWPVNLGTLLEGNSSHIIFEAVPVRQWAPPQAPRKDVWINKTGSTGGFGAYAAFVPGRKIGIVILANKSYPIADRVTLAYRIFEQLDRMMAAVN